MMRRIALTAALGAGLIVVAGCRDTGGTDAAGNDNIAVDANDADGAGATDGDLIMNGTVGTDAETGTGDVDVDVNLKVPQPKLEASPDGVTVDAGDDPAVSVTTNRN